jgi:hypothetical protein
MPDGRDVEYISSFKTGAAFADVERRFHAKRLRCFELILNSFAVTGAVIDQLEPLDRRRR